MFILVCIAPLFKRNFWRRYNFLLTAFVLFGIVSLLLRLIRFVLPGQYIFVEVLVSLLRIVATAIFGTGLLRGQQVTKFFPEWTETVFVIALAVVMFLPLKLSGEDIIVELKEHWKSDG